MGLNDSFKFYNYLSDDGNLYALKLTAANAAAGGFSSVVNPTTTPPYPYGAGNVRFVWLTTGTQRTKLPCATPAFSLFVSGGSVTLRGRSYTVQGQIGERRALNNLS